ncbi:FadR/GntR family transcriptional regulator [Nakamurella endophytica]|uniref:Transcriptional regulator n=1 Tax=Nakamurella endophytica TaxID=1748367 RepID=A0A917T947_9ACTN|nr:FadR/GntR family transcriptional regulator [Nakamurella endophytica]GGM14996.1 transcriptional regulator [Nakamurella endophytica]
MASERVVDRRGPGTSAERILDLIRQRGLKAGDAIPTELELMADLGIARNTLRESIRELRAFGILDVRHGHGTFVAEPSLRSLAPSLVFRAVAGGPDDLAGLANLVEVRERLEVAMMPDLAGRLPADQVEELHALCDAMADQSGGDEPRAALDRRFHRALYARLRNPLVGELVDVFWDAYHVAHHQLSDPAPNEASTTAQRHRAIVDALVGGESAAAADAMRNHFVDIRRRLDAAMADRGA